jgi:hypothetical protein
MAAGEAVPGPEALTAPMPRAHADPVQGPMPAPGTNPTEVLGIRPPGLPAGSGAAAPQATHDTTRLDPALAGAQADPGAATTVLARGEAVAGGTDGPGAQAPAALLSRRAAAELGVYAGAGLVVVAVLGVAVRGWADWTTGMRAAGVALTAVALLATGLFVRLPWARQPGDERRRAVSVLLTTGMATVAVATGLALEVRQGSAGVPATAHALGSVLGMLLVVVVARTPLAELGLLAAGAWAVWVVVPAGLWTWVGLAGLGVAWALLGARLARGRRTAAVAGTALALVGAVGMAQGALAWPVRGALAALAVGGLAAFLRGGAGHWLALGAASATALAASVAGGQLGPAPALLVGGLATMGVSAIALRSARRST